MDWWHTDSMVRRGPHNPAISWLPHLQLSWGGTLGNAGQEIWTNGVRFHVPDYVGNGPDTAGLQAIMVAVDAQVKAWVLDVGSLSGIGSDVKYEWVKANWVLASGLQRDTNTNRADAVGGPYSGHSGLVPWYQTYAITLQTGFKRGRAHTGRIFPPIVAYAPELGTGLVSAAAANDMTTAAKNMFNGIQAGVRAEWVAGVTGHLAVLSPGNSAIGTGAVAAQIQAVVVDRIPDVQHRRTNRLVRTLGAVQQLTA